MRALFLIALAAMLAPESAQAQTVVSSAGPDRVSITLYRAPNRGADDAIDRKDPEGFALVTETRTITIPAGAAVIRFEGVAGNILPESALVAGLPGGVEEKNLDADLLSPRTLFDRMLGRRVMIRRLNPATGKVVELQAVIKSSADGAAVIETGGGYEGLRCSGLPEKLVYNAVPGDLSAKPTLSVRTTSATERRVTLTLSYLAGGFDWQADYVVTMRKDGRSADLFAWITLASSDMTSFVDADTQVVAGKLNRSDSGDSLTPSGGDLALKCWPLPSYNFPDRRYYPPQPAPPPMAMAPPPAPMSALMERNSDGQDIVVTGSKIRPEQLADLKLYRFPARVTVASNGQKQVALLTQPGVSLVPVYLSEIDDDDEVGDTKLILRTRNRTDAGLGLPLPAGQVAVFTDVAGRRLLVGKSWVEDKAVDQDVEFELGETAKVSADTDLQDSGNKWDRYRLTVSNANPWPIDYEAKIRVRDGGKLEKSSDPLGKKDGAALWIVRVPANGVAMLDYTVREPKD